MLQISVNDLGNTGEGGALVDQTTVDIGITPDATNDPPVNTVPGTQATYEETPLVFSDTAGNQISINDDTGPGNVTVKLTATDGAVTLSNTSGGEFLVNTDISGDQDDVQTAMAPDGRFVMVWTSAGQDGSGDGIYAQLYDISGAPLGGEARWVDWARVRPRGVWRAWEEETSLKKRSSRVRNTTDSTSMSLWIRLFLT